MRARIPASMSKGAPRGALFSVFLAIVGLAFLANFSFARSGVIVESMTVVTSSGEHAFEVEVADTDQKREHGLMDRRSMPANHGMLFDFQMETPVAMWMKNTHIPLDMVFVSRTGLVTGIAPDATPMSEDIISSGGPAYAVIEFNAGTAKRIGLVPGDRVRHRIFRP